MSNKNIHPERLTRSISANIRVNPLHTGTIALHMLQSYYPLKSMSDIANWAISYAAHSIEEEKGKLFEDSESALDFLASRGIVFSTRAKETERVLKYKRDRLARLTVDKSPEQLLSQEEWEEAMNKRFLEELEKERNEHKGITDEN